MRSRCEPVRSILHDSLRAYRASWLGLTAIGVTILVPAYALSVWAEETRWLIETTVESDGAVYETSWGGVIAGTCVLCVAYTLVQGAVTASLRRGETGRKSWRGVATTTARSAPSLILCSILALLGFCIGLILLVVPGVFVLVRWAVFAPAAVLERRALSSLARSSRLVRGEGPTVFGVIVVLIMLNAPSGVASFFLSSTFWNWPITLIADVVVVPLCGTMVTVLYYRLLSESDIEPAPRVDRHREDAIDAADQLGPRGGLG